MTEAEAKVAVNDYVNELKKKKMSIRVGVDQNVVTATIDELGFSYRLGDTINRALNLGT